MPLAAYVSNQGAQYHKNEILPKLIDVNLIPNVDHREEVFVDDHVCILSFEPSADQKVLISESHVLALEGDVINIPSLDAILQKYLSDGDHSVEGFNGNFNLVIYDRRNHQLKALNCRASVYNLYIHAREDRVTIASNIRSIVRCMDQEPALDLQSLYRFFVFGYIFGDDTLLKGVRRVAPASVISVDGKRVDTKTYWQPTFSNEFDLDLRGVSDEFNQRLIEGTAERFAYFKDIKIFLSGGLDSRLIAGAAEKAGISAETVTYGFEGSRDLTYGRMTSERLGFPNHQYITEPGVSTTYSDLLSLVVWLTASETNIKSFTSTKYHPFLLERGVKNYSHGGTIGLVSTKLIQPYMLYPTEMCDKIAITFDRLRSRSVGNWDTILNPDFYNEQGRTAQHAFSESFNEMDDACFSNRFIAWYYRNREPRTTYNSMQINGYYFKGLMFFVDNRLLDFYFRVPLRYRQEALWEKMSCLTLNEKIKDVPYQATGKPISTSLTQNLINRVTSKLLRNTRFGYKAKHKDARRDTLTDTRLKAYLLDQLGEVSPLRDIIDKDSTEALINAHFSGERDVTLTILNLASAFKFNELFLKERCKSFPEEAKTLLARIPYPRLKR